MAAIETLHPALWHAHQLGRASGDALPTGFAALDAQLPGGGWPRRVLTELLLAQHGIGEMRLLAPVLARCAAAGVMLFDPPAPLSAWALAQMGVPAQALVVVHGRHGAHGARHLLPAADLLWALEQALHSGQVGALLAWLPARLNAQALRRLQLAAQSHAGPAFMLRELQACTKPSPAPLRLALHAAGIDVLTLRVLKRRGPALAQPLRLALPPVLAPLHRARAEAARLPATVPAVPSAAASAPLAG